MHFLSFVYMRVYTCHEWFKVKNRILACLLTVRLIYVHICMYRGLCMCAHPRVHTHILHQLHRDAFDKWTVSSLSYLHFHLILSLAISFGAFDFSVELNKISVIWNYFIWCQRSFSNPLRCGFISKPNVCSLFCNYILWNTCTRFSTIIKSLN